MVAATKVAYNMPRYSAYKKVSYKVISFLLFIIMIVGIVLVFTFIGVHQIVVVTALVTQMDAGMIGTRPEVLALLLIMSWSMSAVISPVNPINLLVSGLLEKSGISVGLRWNGVFFYLLC
ncbi:hypothetical protein BABA_02267 [Neobacillus bataviensis LMG 21833]|uniref:Citrate transporter n=2 Tax=Neobacillus bataviensis TaxID=220685 RepID=K6DSI3_9BACI|nr:hypothetical protein BABA_02267 [Neobacillus bataviensis LMG 21833]